MKFHVCTCVYFNLVNVSDPFLVLIYEPCRIPWSLQGAGSYVPQILSPLCFIYCIVQSHKGDSREDTNSETEQCPSFHCLLISWFLLFMFSCSCQPSSLSINNVRALGSGSWADCRKLVSVCQVFQAIGCFNDFLLEWLL